MLGVIGGSGLYEIDGLENSRWETVGSSFGEPSDQLFFGEIEGQTVVFLPRHGRGHVQAPDTVNYRANIDALKRAGVTHVLSISACGSFREEHSPGTFVLVDQFIDRTTTREKSFFGSGLVAHVSMAHPVCGGLCDLVKAAAVAEDIHVHPGGTYLAMQGPQFSSLAESNMYRSWGCDVIGMTNMPEAKLAREAELHYASVAMVTDYDCWHEDHDNVEVVNILRVLHDNADRARALVRCVIPMFADPGPVCRQACDRVLDTAIITAPDARDPAMIARLEAVAGRVL